MCKKLTCVLLSLLLAFGQTLAICAEQAQQPATEPGQTQQTPVERQNAELEAELELSQLPLYDRYIVKLKPTNSLAAADTSLGTAVEAAIPAAKSAASAQVQEVFTEKQITEDTELFNLSEMPAYTVESQSSELLTVTLTEKVDAAAFTQELSGNAQIEYVQPDYTLELASDVVLDLDLSELEPAVTAAPQIDMEITPEVTQEPTPTPETEPTPDATPEPSATPVAAPVVAVIDAGIDMAHYGLVDQMLPGYDFVNNTELVYDSSKKDEYYHGTHVAGIVAQNAPEVQILPLKVFEHGRAYTSDIIRAIEYAEQYGASVVNMSFGGTDDNRALKEAMQASGMLFVCAAGNHRLDVAETPVYPACFDLDNIISVASLNQDLGFSYYSNYGTASVDIAAVGRDVESMWPEGAYGEMSGTSMAAAQVSAGAAVALAQGLDAKAGVLSCADRLAHLENKVADGRSFSLANIRNGVQSGDVQTVEYEDDFDVHGYVPTPEESWELFNAVETVDVEIGSYCVYFVKEDGSVWASGDNSSYNLGNPDIEGFVTTPVRVIGLTDVKEVFSKGTYTYAWKNDNTLWGWGWEIPYLQSPTVIKHPVPIYSGTMAGVKQFIAAYPSDIWLSQDGTVNSSHFPLGYITDPIIKIVNSWQKYAVAEDGTVWQWGGIDNSSLDPSPPFKNPELTGFIDFCDQENFSVFLKNDGTVWVKGDNSYGQLGMGDTTERTQLVQNPYLSDIVSIYQAGETIFALNEAGQFYGFGQNIYGIFGNGMETQSNIPVLLGFSNVKDIVFGVTSAMVKNDGTVWTWGNNSFGQMGIGTTDNSSTPVQVVNFEDIGQKPKFAAGNGHTLFVDSDGGLWASGRGTHGQLGNGLRENSTTPVRVKDSTGNGNFTDVAAVGAGFLYSLALKYDGTLWTWGNATGFMTDSGDSHSDLPIQVKDDQGNYLTDITAISAQKEHWLALKQDGTVWAWGKNDCGQLGNNQVGSACFTNAVQVKMENGQPLVDVEQISAGAYHSMALTYWGGVYCWGKNENGQLGNGQTQNCNYPFFLESLGADNKEVSAGEFHSMVRKADGTVWSWGRNQYGQLGDNTRNNSLTPVQVKGENGIGFLTNAKKIAAGAGYSTAITADEKLYTWGHNYMYQLGDGTQQSKNAPVAVMNNVEAIYANYDTTMARTSDRKVWIWGTNGYGQFGDGTSGNYSALPVRAFYTDTGLSLTLQGKYIIVSVEHLTDTSKRFKLTYDPSKLSLTNIAAQKNVAIITPGTYGRLIVDSVSNGEVVFGLNLQFDGNKQWSGAITVFEANALTDGETTVGLDVL